MYKKLKNANYFLIIFSMIIEITAIIIGILLLVSILNMNNYSLEIYQSFKTFTLTVTSILITLVLIC